MRCPPDPLSLYDIDKRRALETVHGVWGGINPHGEIGEMSFTMNPMPYPRLRRTDRRSPDGSLGHEVVEEDSDIAAYKQAYSVPAFLLNCQRPARSSGMSWKTGLKNWTGGWREIMNTAVHPNVDTSITRRWISPVQTDTFIIRKESGFLIMRGHAFHIVYLWLPDECPRFPMADRGFWKNRGYSAAFARKRPSL